MGSGSAAVSFTGIPGYSYHIERATNVLFSGGITNWPSVTNSPISVTDYFSDLGVTPRQVYYRLCSP